MPDTENNVHVLPTRIERLAEKIKNDLARQAEGALAWREATFDLCVDLAELRQEYSSNAEFGQVCQDYGFGMSHQDRAAAIAMGRDPEALRACLEATKSHSIRLIHQQEFQYRLTNAGKMPTDHLTTAGKTPPPKKKSPEPKKKNHALEVFDRLADEGRTFNRDDLAKEAGVSYGTAQRAFDTREMEAKVRPITPLDPATAPPSVRERMEAWQRAESKRLRETIEAEIREKYDLSTDAWVRSVRERAAWAEKILKRDRGLMSQVEYNTIVKCLHPDTAPDAALKAEAFRLFTQHRKVLIKPEAVESGLPLPSLSELLARRREKLNEGRRAKGKTAP